MKQMIMMMLLAGWMTGCSSSKPETPQEAAAAISGLLEKGDYDTLFRERYSEWHKVEAEGVDPEVAIERMSARLEKQRETFVKMFDQMASADFTLSENEYAQKTETGEMATTTITLDGKEMPYRLYKMKNGLWGFHM